MMYLAQRAAARSSISRQRVAIGALVLAVAAALLAVALGPDAIASGGWSLYGLLMFLHSAAAGAFVVVGVAVTGLVLETLITLELLHKAVLAAAVAGPMAFAQQNDSSPAASEDGTGAESRTAQREIQFGIYGGGNGVFNADIHLKQPNGTDMTLKNVVWEGQPFDDPPYYGVRATYWPEKSPSLGVMLDYVHGKAISRRHDEVEQTGMRDGEKVPPREPVSATFTKIEYSHGLNFLTLNAVYRFRGLHRKFLPYFGAGFGIMVPHSEAARRGTSRENWDYRYEVSGPGFQALAGMEWRAKETSRFHPFAEVKLGYGRNTTELYQGGWVKANLLAYQVAVGVTAYVSKPALIGATP